MRRLQPDGPRLGLVSTRELLEELLARMETSDIAYSYDVLLAVRAFLRDAPPGMVTAPGVRAMRGRTSPRPWAPGARARSGHPSAG